MGLCRVLLFLALLVAAPAAASTMDCVMNDGFDGELSGVPAAYRGVMQQHNCARKTVVPRPVTAIPPLTWNSTVASFAQTHANTCVYGHVASAYGENIYAYSADAAPAEPDPLVVDDWVSEGLGYNYAANTCSDPRGCLHYTQIVWRSTLRVGCGFKFCTSNTPFPPPFTKWVFVVCNYDPPGNNGNRPY